MTRTLADNENRLADLIERTLTYLGFAPEDVEVVLTWGDPRFATVSWSAQTSVGDMPGTLRVPIYAPLDPYAVRRDVAEIALARSRALAGNT